MAPGVTPLSVLVVEDDPAVRRFVVLALSDLPVEVEDCASVAEAKDLLAFTAFPLVILDLTLQEESSGLELIEFLMRSGGDDRQTKVMVFSAGLHAAMRQKLQAMGVWCCLSKPATQTEIQECVREALDLSPWPEGPIVSAPPRSVDQDGLEPHELAAIEEYFDGDKVFFLQFRSACLKQFVLDLAQGDQACAHGDAGTLRRTVHSLKSILLTLGRADDSMFAASLEETVQKRPWDEAVTGWRLMRARMKASFGVE